MQDLFAAAIRTAQDFGMRLLAIDPGPIQSAWLVYHEDQPEDFGKADNDRVLSVIQSSIADQLAVEMIASYGMPVGVDVFSTCVWVGRFVQQWVREDREFPTLIPRMSVKMHLCGQSRAKDPNVRQALIDRYGPGRELAIGRKAAQGPLYGVSGDVWAALGVAVTVGDSIAAKAVA